VSSAGAILNLRDAADQPPAKKSSTELTESDTASCPDSTTGKIVGDDAVFVEGHYCAEDLTPAESPCIVETVPETESTHPVEDVAEEAPGKSDGWGIWDTWTSSGNKKKEKGRPVFEYFKYEEAPAAAPVLEFAFAEEAPAEEAPAEETPAEAPAEEAPAEETPAEAAVEEAPAEEMPAEAPVEEAPAEEAPYDVPAEEAPVEEAPCEVPAEKWAVCYEEAPAPEAPVEEWPACYWEAPVPEAPAEEAPAEETPAEEAPAEDAPAEETPAEDAPAEDAPAEEAPAEEAPAEEAPAEEAPAEEAPAETPVEEAPAEERAICYEEDAADRFASLPVFRYQPFAQETKLDNTPCRRRGHHLADDDRWMKCSKCRAELSAIAREMTASTPGWRNFS
jgi:hypothetical protein